jgi:hypothetical protein
VPVPQPQAPPTHDSVAAQATHPAPAVPHWLAVGGLTQVVPLQQPPQLAPSQTQIPPEQCWPIAHAAPLPQEHVPLSQLSAVVALQGVQLAPPEPCAHFATVWAVRHWPVEQHPFGQLLASHTQPTFMSQRWPAAHGGPPLQVHAPALEQPLVVVGSQAKQATPFAPHALALRGRPNVQLVPEQQVLQPTLSHTQVPPEQCWPTAHWFPPPQRQPAAPPQLSARIGSQVKQPAPLPPQALSDGEVHTLPLQQPAQLDESQTHWPALLQCCPASQSGPAPQPHTPLLQLLPSCPQLPQVPPLVPQKVPFCPA